MTILLGFPSTCLGSGISIWKEKGTGSSYVSLVEGKTEFEDMPHFSACSTAFPVHLWLDWQVD